MRVILKEEGGEERERWWMENFYERASACQDPFRIFSVESTACHGRPNRHITKVVYVKSIDVEKEKKKERRTFSFTSGEWLSPDSAARLERVAVARSSPCLPIKSPPPSPHPALFACPVYWTKLSDVYIPTSFSNVLYCSARTYSKALKRLFGEGAGRGGKDTVSNHADS